MLSNIWKCQKIEIKEIVYFFPLQTLDCWYWLMKWCYCWYIFFKAILIDIFIISFYPNPTTIIFTHNSMFIKIVIHQSVSILLCPDSQSNFSLSVPICSFVILQRDVISNNQNYSVGVKFKFLLCHFVVV